MWAFPAWLNVDLRVLEEVSFKLANTNQVSRLEGCWKLLPVAHKTVSTCLLLSGHRGGSPSSRQVCHHCLRAVGGSQPGSEIRSEFPAHLQCSSCQPSGVPAGDVAPYPWGVHLGGLRPGLYLCAGKQSSGLPRWLSGKLSTWNARDMGSIPGLGRSLEERNGTQLQYSCLENPMDRDAWWVTVPGAAESGTTERQSWAPAGLVWVGEESLRVSQPPAENLLYLICKDSHLNHTIFKILPNSDFSNCFLFPPTRRCWDIISSLRKVWRPLVLVWKQRDLSVSNILHLDPWCWRSKPGEESREGLGDI